MRVIERRNVNHMLSAGLSLLAKEGQRMDSRAGPVVVAPFPVVSIYQNPTERVLMGTDRNPFFHLYEALWMLAGRNDAAPLNRYVKDFGSRFAETDGGIHGTYGHRWRRAFGFDQLNEIVRRLKQSPQDRQCVIQMWDATPTHYVRTGGTVEGNGDIANDGYSSGSEDLLGDWKDRPCNTHAYVRVHDNMLDFTVCCRSNDIVWGAYGANAVHFSFLQEYLAGRIGVGVGKLYQFSNNYHGYVEVLDKMGAPSMVVSSDPYGQGGAVPVPIMSHADAWDNDLDVFMTWHDTQMHEKNYEDVDAEVARAMANEWFGNVAVPMLRAHWLWRNVDTGDGIVHMQHVEADDWRQAGTEWLTRRSA